MVDAAGTNNVFHKDSELVKMYLSSLFPPTLRTDNPLNKA